ncbi:MAG: septum formation protein Maf [Desulfobacteraceae bacterium 4572_87]|nr:MAG: septum formation protein Maf [Desulfobacteraceae bacterium 4572_87]
MMIPIDETHPLVLASASPRRKRLLARMNIPHRVVVSHVNEERTDESPENFCRSLALLKAREVDIRENGSWILGADTLVVAGGRALGKPESHEAAREMISLLSGKNHQVITGFCVLNPHGMIAHSEVVTTEVRFKPLSEEEITGYIRTHEPFGKAGAYAIQGVGAFMVEAISGSYTNVVGLPMCAFIKALLKCGALKSFP